MKKTAIILFAFLITILNGLQYHFILSKTCTLRQIISTAQFIRSNELNFSQQNDNRSVNGIRETTSVDLNGLLTSAPLASKKSIKFILIKFINTPYFSPHLISQEQLFCNCPDVITLFNTERSIMNNLVVIRI